MKSLQEMVGLCGISAADLRSGILAMCSAGNGSEGARLRELHWRRCSRASRKGWTHSTSGASFPRRNAASLRGWAADLRVAKKDNGLLVFREICKIIEEGLGEAQERIEICDCALSVSLQLHRKTTMSKCVGYHKH